MKSEDRFENPGKTFEGSELIREAIESLDLYLHNFEIISGEKVSMGRRGFIHEPYRFGFAVVGFKLDSGDRDLRDFSEIIHGGGLRPDCPMLEVAFSYSDAKDHFIESRIPYSFKYSEHDSRKMRLGIDLRGAVWKWIEQTSAGITSEDHTFYQIHALNPANFKN